MYFHHPLPYFLPWNLSLGSTCPSCHINPSICKPDSFLPCPVNPSFFIYIFILHPSIELPKASLLAVLSLTPYSQVLTFLFSASQKFLFQRQPVTAQALGSMAHLIPVSTSRLLLWVPQHCTVEPQLLSLFSCLLHMLLSPLLPYKCKYSPGIFSSSSFYSYTCCLVQTHDLHSNLLVDSTNMDFSCQHLNTHPHVQLWAKQPSPHILLASQLSMAHIRQLVLSNKPVFYNVYFS